MMHLQRIRHAHPFTLLLISILAAPMIAMLPAIALERGATTVARHRTVVPIALEQPDFTPPKRKPRARHTRRAPRLRPLNTPALRVGFSWPVAKAPITSPFGWRPFVVWPGMPKGPHPKKQFHHGEDILCALNQPVSAAKAGVVVMSGTNADYGNVIVIAHPGGWSTLYGHLNKRLVPAGRRVAAHALIGLCGMTGHATGVHLHFEVRHYGRFFDPKYYLP
jgi:murein DD-endopeptidase MepM/ murein hydrolase activator NlpD